MIFFGIVLAGLGLIFSAFFSGSETGFYKVSRLRLKLDAMEDKPHARLLLRLVNQPTLFVATVLVGNNLANYSISLSTVIVTSAILGNASGATYEIFATLCVSPFFFLYGELFPKHLFLLAPDRLLRLATPILAICFVLFLPISICLWCVNFLLARLIGKSHEQIKLSLAKSEFAETFDDGTLAGVLHRTQRELVDNVLAASEMKTRRLIMPHTMFPILTTSMNASDALRAIRTQSAAEIPVYHPRGISSPNSLSNDAALLLYHRVYPAGYVKQLELFLCGESASLPIHQCKEIRLDASTLHAAAALVESDSALGALVDSAGHCYGFISCTQVLEQLNPPEN